MREERGGRAGSADAGRKRSARRGRRSPGRGSGGGGGGGGGGDADRYGRLADLLHLCVQLQGSLHGVSKAQVARAYGVSERTASRMLSAVEKAFGERLEAHSGPDRVKRWVLREGPASSSVRWEAEELAALDAAAKLAARDGRRDDEAALRATLTKIRALVQPQSLRRIDPDLEVLMEAQGVAMRPGPHPRIDVALVRSLREAILKMRKVRLVHRNAETGEPRRHVVGPLGFLYGVRYYLVAWSAARRQVLLYRLSRIEHVEPLAEGFDAPPHFDLRRYAARSFGTFQEEPVNVDWRFHPEVAEEAKEWTFHPHQVVDEEPDGSVRVRFRAGGVLEMAWHLFTWGPHVEVLEPKALRSRLTRLLREALEVHEAPRRGRRR